MDGLLVLADPWLRAIMAGSVRRVHSVAMRSVRLAASCPSVVAASTPAVARAPFGRQRDSFTGATRFRPTCRSRSKPPALLVPPMLEITPHDAPARTPERSIEYTHPAARAVAEHVHAVLAGQVPSVGARMIPDVAFSCRLALLSPLT